jgi:uncharacterized membrane protein YdjX (TVP38/TMEM64 family)
MEERQAIPRQPMGSNKCAGRLMHGVGSAREGKWAVLLGGFIPFVPFDAVSYFSGLVKMKILAFTVLTFVGSVPRCLFYAYMGEFIAEYNIPVLIIISVIIVIFLLIFKIRSRAKNQDRAILSQATSKCN